MTKHMLENAPEFLFSFNFKSKIEILLFQSNE